MNRYQCYLFCYDITAPKRSRRVLKKLKRYCWEKQKSACICYLQQHEFIAFRHSLVAELDAEEDLFFSVLLQHAPQKLERDQKQLIKIGPCLILGGR